MGGADANKWQPRIPGGEREETNSTVGTKNPPAQNSLHCSVRSKPLLLKVFLGEMCVYGCCCHRLSCPHTRVGSGKPVCECGSSSCQSLISTTQINTSRNHPGGMHTAASQQAESTAGLSPCPHRPVLSGTQQVLCSRPPKQLAACACLHTDQPLRGLLTSLDPRVPGPSPLLPPSMGSEQHSSVPGVLRSPAQVLMHQGSSFGSNVGQPRPSRRAGRMWVRACMCVCKEEGESGQPEVCTSLEGCIAV